MKLNMNICGQCLLQSAKITAEVVSSKGISTMTELIGRSMLNGFKKSLEEIDAGTMTEKHMGEDGECPFMKQIETSFPMSRPCMMLVEHLVSEEPVSAKA